jgi:hypothetical protein
MKKKKSLGVMIDLSRNAVMSLPALKDFLTVLKKFGYNTVFLYMEDTYEVEGEEYFGYMRGRYSVEEMKEIDDLCTSLGIEAIPCIQTLAHMKTYFKWGQVGVDCDDILLVDDNRTYELISNMFKTLSKCFKSRRIHIGMDEAHMLGRGKYFDRYGQKSSNEIIKGHLEKICALAKPYGYELFVWSDMFFRPWNGGEYYFNEYREAPKDAKEALPQGVQPVYWDYYSDSQRGYDTMIKMHKQLKGDVWFAGGAWCWGGFTPHNKLSIRRNKIALPVCIEKGVKNVLLTMWGDDGGECPPFAVLPALMNAAASAEGMSEEEMKAKFLEITGVSYDNALSLDTANYIYGDNFGVGSSNYSKNRLYNDIFLGITDKNNEHPVNSEIFAEKAALLRNAQAEAGKLSYLFDTQAALCEALAVKFDLGERTRDAYSRGDKEALLALAQNDYTEFLEKLDAFYEAFRNQWNEINKPYGFETHDARLGGLMLRTKNCRRRLLDYCNGAIDSIPELCEDVLVHDGGNVGGWSKIITACPI